MSYNRLVYLYCTIHIENNNSKNQYNTYKSELAVKMISNGDSKSKAAVTTASKSPALMKLSSYVLALRPWSLSASLMPTLLGSTIAYKCTVPVMLSIRTLISSRELTTESLMIER
ncbi:heixuedian [Carabus blaptoides fortunei]